MSEAVGLLELLKPHKGEGFGAEPSVRSFVEESIDLGFEVACETAHSAKAMGF